MFGGLLWQIIVFVELIVILVNSKQNKIVKAVKRSRGKSFGENVIYTSVMHKKIKVRLGFTPNKRKSLKNASCSNASKIVDNI